MVNGSVRSAFGDPDLRSPSGFDSRLRPPLRMTRRADLRHSDSGITIYSNSRSTNLLTGNAETNESLLQWEKVAAAG